MPNFGKGPGVEVLILLPAGVLTEDVMPEISASFKAVNLELLARATSSSPEIESVLAHLIAAGGKRLRPLLTLLAARCFSPDISMAVPVAVSAELIHMATLAHDDIIDKSATRRGKPTINSIWGNHTAVLAGDVLLARALVTLASTGRLDVVEIMSRMVDVMCSGEIQQNVTAFSWEETEEDYLKRIEQKTASFFAACCQAGALAGGASTAEAAAMSDFGRYIGLAYQVVDDLLDICAGSATLGKPAGNDLVSGVITLPIIYTLQNEVSQELRPQLTEHSVTQVMADRLIAAAHDCGAVEYSRNLAAALTRQAKVALPELAWPAGRAYLEAIADTILQRAY